MMCFCHKGKKSILRGNKGKNKHVHVLVTFNNSSIGYNLMVTCTRAILQGNFNFYDNVFDENKIQLRGGGGQILPPNQPPKIHCCSFILSRSVVQFASTCCILLSITNNDIQNIDFIFVHNDLDTNCWNYFHCVISIILLTSFNCIS